MFKRLASIVLVTVMVMSFTECSQISAKSRKGQVKYKIGLMTPTVSQGEEEYRAAEKIKKEYGEMIVHQTFPDKFTTEQETTVANALSIASDPDVKAIVFVQGVVGTAAAINKIKEKRPDILTVVGCPGEDPTVIGKAADVVSFQDVAGMGLGIVKQAKKEGAKTFVHYSFPRHMSNELNAQRRDGIRKACKELGLKFLDVTAPDPMSDAGIAGTQQFILEDIPRKVQEYGKNTAFFGTNTAMQDPMVKMCVQEKAIFPVQPDPSPFVGYPTALGIKIPEDKKGDVTYMLDQIKASISKKGLSGRFSTWTVPLNMMFIDGSVKYAMAYVSGKTKGKADKAKLQAIYENYAGGKLSVNNYVDKSGNKFNNFFLITGKYITF